MITMLCPQNRKRKRWDRLGQSVVLDSIPAHVRHLDRLFRESDRTCVYNLRMDKNHHTLWLETRALYAITYLMSYNLVVKSFPVEFAELCLCCSI